MANKMELIRGFLVSDQYLSQRKLLELSVGQVYFFKKHWLKYIGKIGKKHKFEELTCREKK